MGEYLAVILIVVIIIIFNNLNTKIRKLEKEVSDLHAKINRDSVPSVLTGKKGNRRNCHSPDNTIS